MLDERRRHLALLIDARLEQGVYTASMASCAGCGADVPEDGPAGRVPCPHCGATGRRFVECMADRLVARDHIAGRTQREGRTVGYSESSRHGTASSGDVEGANIVHRIHGASPQGEQDTIDTARRFVEWLNRDQARWAEPIESSAPYTDAFAEGVGDNAGAILRMQVVRSVADPNVWHQLSKSGVYSAAIRIDASARTLWDAVDKKATKIGPEHRCGLVLLLDANRCPGQAFPDVVEAYRRLFTAMTADLGFDGVYVVGSWSDSIASLTG